MATRDTKSIAAEQTFNFGVAGFLCTFRPQKTRPEKGADRAAELNMGTATKVCERTCAAARELSAILSEVQNGAVTFKKLLDQTDRLTLAGLSSGRSGSSCGGCASSLAPSIERGASFAKFVARRVRIHLFLSLWAQIVVCIDK